MLADVEELRNATAFLGQHNDTHRWGVVLQFDNGVIWTSEDTFASREEAQEAFDDWVHEIGGTQQKLH